MLVTVRLIDPSDWPAIDVIQQQAYPESLHEDLTVLQQKQQLSPDTCWVVVDGDDQVLGYLLTHRWHDATQPPSLDTTLQSAEGPILYIHDMALSVNAQGLGLSMQLWRVLLDYVREHQVHQLALIAVNDSKDFWQHKGFEHPTLLSVEKGYGDSAYLMHATL